MAISKGETCSIFVKSRECDACGECLEVCEENAISIHDQRFVDRSLCTCCGDCVETCAKNALTIVMKEKGLPPFSKKTARTR